MRVLVTGAYGLIGSACLARLHADGHDLVAAGRSIAGARRRFPYARWIETDFARLTGAQAWLPHLAGVDAVVNCVGVLQDGAGDNVERVQLAGTVALFEGCARAGVKRIVHISAIGAETAGPSAFSRTKAAAETRLKSLDLDWMILRPGLVLAPAVYGSTAMLRGIAAFPCCVPLAAADARIQVIGDADLAETVALGLRPDAPSRVVWDVAHPQVHTLAGIVTAIRGWLGFAPRRVLRLPSAAGKVAAALADAIGWLGWRSPARSTSLAQLGFGVVGDPAGWMQASGIAPRSLDEILAVRPANVQDRWFARLYLIKPLALAGIACSAISLGVSGVVDSLNLALAVLPGIPLSAFVIYVLPGLLGGAIELGTGVAMLVRRTARPALIVMLILTLLATADNIVSALTVRQYPLTAAILDIPMLLALLFTLAILDDR
jgi:uncharacterized protein YbjT (DUF2867 family)